jgi:O-antigen ligase
VGTVKARPSSNVHRLPVRSVPATRASHPFEVCLVAGICLLLAFGPLAFGAVQAWAICVLETGAACLLLLWGAWQVSRPQPSIRVFPVFVPLALFGILIGAQLVFRLSAYWYETWSHALLFTAYGALFFLASQCFSRTVHAMIFAVFFTFFGFGVALFAVAQEFASNGKIYWIVPNRNLGYVYGPYVNHAHYAGLMELLVPIPVVIAMGRLTARPIRLLFGFAALLMGASIFLSRSVGGMVAFSVEIGVLAVFLFRRKSKNRVWLLAALVAALAISLALARPAARIQRLSDIHHPMASGTEGLRVAIVKDSMGMIEQHPVVGWGLGTFPVIYPSFRSFYTNLFVNEAHNDFVQLLVETGILGFSLILIFLFLTYWAGLRSVDHWRSEPRAAIVLAALVGCTGLLIHGLGDFNLQIPANAAIFSAIAAIAATGNAPPLRS